MKTIFGRALLIISTKRFSFVILLVLLSVFTACKKKQDKSAEELAAQFKEIHLAMRQGETQSAAAAIQALFPNQAEIETILKEDEKAFALKIAEYQKRYVPKGAEATVALFNVPDYRTVIKVHHATTEELIEAKKGSAARMEFPSGVLQIAPKILKPGADFFEIEMLEPGHESGTKFHMFFKSPQGWKMLGPVWRVP